MENLLHWILTEKIMEVSEARGKKKRAKCSWMESVFKNAFFEKAHPDLERVLVFINVSLRECFPFLFVKTELQLSDPTTVDWARGGACGMVC